MIFIKRSAEPEILRTQGKTQASDLCAAYNLDAENYDKGKRAFEFDNDIYAHQAVKDALNKMQHGKCCFCESKLMHITFGDVEHYRPKAGYKQTAREKLKKPGYYWLAYEWENLLLCCERCNRQHKKNLFPLLHPEKRARSHRDDVIEEMPLMINPADIDPQDHIGFRDEIPYATNDKPYGKVTIAILKLDREDLSERRREKLSHIKTLLDIIKSAENYPDQRDLMQLAEEAKQVLPKFMEPNAEYSAMAKAFCFPANFPAQHP
jgi:uncharacterized protein (TIGR02646 family)